MQERKKKKKTKGGVVSDEVSYYECLRQVLFFFPEGSTRDNVRGGINDINTSNTVLRNRTRNAKNRGNQTTMSISTV